MDPTKDKDVKENTKGTKIHWPHIIEDIEDGYRQYVGEDGLGEAVQKDAIQNSWDARVHGKEEKWKFTLNLITSPKLTALTLTDQGTTGMNSDGWSRFESYGFRKPGKTSTLGRRGRGKLIFVAASDSREIYYETLTPDRLYKLGYRRHSGEQEDIVIGPLEGKTAKEKISEWTGLTPLTEVGTRITIINPRDEIIRSIKNKQMLRYISKTWWQIIKDYGAKIYVGVNGEVEQVELPNEISRIEKASAVRILPKIHVLFEGKKYRIDELCIASASEYNKEMNGISLQRGGMTICSLLPEHMPKEISDLIYGYAIFNEETEEVMKEKENPEHFDFDFRGRGLPKEIKRIIQDEMRKFAVDELNLEQTKRIKTSAKEEKIVQEALEEVNKIFEDISRGSASEKGKRTSAPRSAKPVHIGLPDPVFIRENRRFDHGEKMEGILVSAINHSSSKKRVKLTLDLCSGTRSSCEIIDTLVNEEVAVSADSESKKYGPFEIVFTKEGFPDNGRYKLIAKIVDIDNGPKKGDILDIRTVPFFLNETPPGKGGIFSAKEAGDFAGKEDLMADSRRANNGVSYIFEWNGKHPQLEIAEAGGEKVKKHYFAKLMILEGLKIDIDEGEYRFFEDVDTESPIDVYEKILDLYGKLSKRIT